MRISEIVRCLSIKEWTSLCNLIDEKLADGTIVIAGGGETAQLKGRIISKRFDVLQIERGAEKVLVKCHLGQGVVRIFEIDVEQSKKKSKVNRARAA